jgi:hypothetical protein
MVIAFEEGRGGRGEGEGLEARGERLEGKGELRVEGGGVDRLTAYCLPLAADS